MAKPKPNHRPDPVSEKGLPSNPEAERYALGLPLVDKSLVDRVVSDLRAEDFSLQQHRLIFNSFQSLHVRGEPVDRVTVCNELMKQGHLESVGGVGYIASLDEGMPQLSNLDSYIRIVKEHSARRRIILISQKAICLAVEGSEDASSILSILSEDTADIGSLVDVVDQIQDFDDYVATSKGGVDGLLVRPSDMVPTGFPKVDSIIGGFTPGLLYVVGASTSAGKTSFSLNVAEYAASCGFPVLFFSLEMSKAQIFRRLMFSRAEVPLGKYKWGGLTEAERYQLKAQAEAIRRLPLYLDDSGTLGVMDVQTRLSAAIREKNVQLAVVDYLQIMDWTSGGTFKEERVAFSWMTRTLKQTAKHYNIPLILLSQLTRERGRRAPKDNRPKLSDLHGSSSLEKDSDVCILIHRPELDDPKADNKDKAEVIVAKQRDGPTGTVKMKFSGRYTRFTEEEEE